MHLSRRIRKKMHSNNELQEVSRGHSTGGKKPGRAEQSQVLSKRRKETGMKNAEYCQETGCRKGIVRNTKSMRERRVLGLGRSAKGRCKTA